MTDWNATASAPNNATPVGASGSAPFHPVPVPATNATTITPPSASTFAVVTRFWTHRPDATPMRLIATKTPTAATPIHRLTESGQPPSRPTNSPVTTPNAAIAAL